MAVGPMLALLLWEITYAKVAYHPIAVSSIIVQTLDKHTPVELVRLEESMRGYMLVRPGPPRFVG